MPNVNGSTSSDGGGGGANQLLHYQRSFICQVCHFVAASENDLHSHQNKTHNNNFKCDCCHNVYNSLSQLKRHKTMTHPESIFTSASNSSSSTTSSSGGSLMMASASSGPQDLSLNGRQQAPPLIIHSPNFNVPCLSSGGSSGALDLSRQEEPLDLSKHSPNNQTVPSELSSDLGGVNLSAGATAAGADTSSALSAFLVESSPLNLSAAVSPLVPQPSATNPSAAGPKPPAAAAADQHHPSAVSGGTLASRKVHQHQPQPFPSSHDGFGPPLPSPTTKRYYCQYCPKSYKYCSDLYVHIRRIHKINPITRKDGRVSTKYLSSDEPSCNSSSTGSPSSSAALISLPESRSSSSLLEYSETATSSSTGLPSAGISPANSSSISSLSPAVAFVPPSAGSTSPAGSDSSSTGGAAASGVAPTPVVEKPAAAPLLFTTKNQVALKCQQCNFTASYRSMYERHMWSHTQEKPFACEFCDYASRWTGDIKNHILKYHSREWTIDPTKLDEIMTRIRFKAKDLLDKTLLSKPEMAPTVTTTFEHRPVTEERKVEALVEQKMKSVPPKAVTKQVDRAMVLPLPQPARISDLAAMSGVDVSGEVDADEDQDEVSLQGVEEAKLEDERPMYQTETGEWVPISIDSVSSLGASSSSATPATSFTDIATLEKPQAEVAPTPAPGQDVKVCKSNFVATSFPKVRFLTRDPHTRIMKLKKQDGFFYCDFCSQRSHHYEIMLHHIGQHENLRLFKCSACLTRSNYRSDMIRHIKRGRCGDQPDLIELSYDEAKTTLKDYLESDTFRFRYTKSLIRNTRSGAGSSQEMAAAAAAGEIPSSSMLCEERCFKCSECGLRSNSKPALTKHVLAKHSGLEVSIILYSGEEGIDDVVSAVLPRPSPSQGPPQLPSSSTLATSLFAMSSPALNLSTAPSQATKFDSSSVSYTALSNSEQTLSLTSAANNCQISPSTISSSQFASSVSCSFGSQIPAVTSSPLESSSSNENAPDLTASSSRTANRFLESYRKFTKFAKNKRNKRIRKKKTFKCGICNLPSSSKPALVLKHFPRQHPGVTPSIRETTSRKPLSSILDKTSKDTRTIITPGSTSGLTETRKYYGLKVHRCVDCPYRSNWLSDIYKHMRNQHNGSSPACEIIDPKIAKESLSNYEKWFKDQRALRKAEKSLMLSRFTSSAPTMIPLQSASSSTPVSSTSSTTSSKSYSQSSPSTNSLLSPQRTQKWSCPTCPFNSNSFFFAKYHMKKHSAKQFTCKKCKYSLRLPQLVRSHCRRVHQNQKNSTAKFGVSSLVVQTYLPSSVNDLPTPTADVEAVCLQPQASSSERPQRGTEIEAVSNQPAAAPQISHEQQRVLAALRENIAKQEKASKDSVVFSCASCDYVSIYRKPVHRHLLKKHQCTSKAYCIEIPKSRLPEKQYKRLFKAESNPVHKCKLCTFKSKFRSSVMNHLRQAHAMSDRRLCETLLVPDAEADMQQCSLCPYLTSSAEEFQSHLQHHAPSVDRLLKCPKCTFYVAAEAELTQHLELHLAALSKAEEGNMNPARKTVHYSSSKDILRRGKTFGCFICQECGFSANTEMELSAHIKFHPSAHIDSEDPSTFQPTQILQPTKPVEVEASSKVSAFTFNETEDDFETGSDSSLPPSDEVSSPSPHGCFSTQNYHVESFVDDDGHRIYHCRHCPYQKHRKDHVVKHEKMHVAREGTVKCPLCSYNVASPVLLSHHFQKIHRGSNLMASAAASSLPLAQPLTSTHAASQPEERPTSQSAAVNLTTTATVVCAERKAENASKDMSKIENNRSAVSSAVFPGIESLSAGWFADDAEDDLADAATLNASTSGKYLVKHSTENSPYSQQQQQAMFAADMVDDFTSSDSEDGDIDGLPHEVICPAPVGAISLQQSSGPPQPPQLKMLGGASITDVQQIVAMVRNNAQ